MKRSLWQFCAAAALVALPLFCSSTPARAADDQQPQAADRIERLERRLNEMAQRQEKFMRQMAEHQERQARPAESVRDRNRQRTALPGPNGMGQPTPLPGAPMPPVAPAPGQPHSAAAKACKDIAGVIGLCLMIGFVFNILLAIWIFTDIRRRGEGSGIFIALALLAGIPAAIIYTLVRIGDRKV